MESRAGPVGSPPGHPASRCLGLGVTHRQCSPRDSRFKHAETPEGHPVSRVPQVPLGSSVTL
eukprot:356626-Chlamydomonas_euryale.AAC.3